MNLKNAMANNETHWSFKIEAFRLLGAPFGDYTIQPSAPRFVIPDQAGHLSGQLIQNAKAQENMNKHLDNGPARR